MALLCIVLDLRTLPLPLLSDLQQNLLQLGNLYATSAGKWRGGSSSVLEGRIGLFYIQMKGSYRSIEVAYRPSGDFNLRDFHNAVKNIPADCFITESDASGSLQDEDCVLQDLLDFKEICLRGEEKTKKIKLVTSSLQGFIPSSWCNVLEANKRQVDIQFTLIQMDENKSTLAGQASNFLEKLKDFPDGVSAEENFTLTFYQWDKRVLDSMVKKWLLEFNGYLEEPVQALFHFRTKLLDSVGQVSCYLLAPALKMVDGFEICQTCRCHGLQTSTTDKIKPSCRSTRQELAADQLFETGVKIGEGTILNLPSFQSHLEPQNVFGPVSFQVVERTMLNSLNEGLILGAPYIVVPSSSIRISPYSSCCEKEELNAEYFYALCKVLHSLDQGLVCFSTCNTETMRESSFHYFYLLQPSDKGPMLLRKLAGLEEVMPLPCASNTTAREDIESSIQANLTKIDIRDYDPWEHEVGLHMKINGLVKESLRFRPESPWKLGPENDSLHLKTDDIKLNTQCPQAEDGKMLFDYSDLSHQGELVHEISPEWEKLIVHELQGSCPFDFDQANENMLKSPNISLDDRTSRILERLEAPKYQKLRSFPSVVTSDPKNQFNAGSSIIKKSLLPFHENMQDSLITSSQPLKPNFQRSKKKIR